MYKKRNIVFIDFQWKRFFDFLKFHFHWFSMETFFVRKNIQKTVSIENQWKWNLKKIKNKFPLKINENDFSFFWHPRLVKTRRSRVAGGYASTISSISSRIWWFQDFRGGYGVWRIWWLAGDFVIRGWILNSNLGFPSTVF